MKHSGIFFFIWLILFSFNGSGQDVVSFNLINTVNNTVIHQLHSGDTINLSLTPQISIQAITNPVTVGSVIFDLSGPLSHNRTEGVAPYSLFGDNNNSYYAWSNPQPGNYTLSATAYQYGGGTGMSGNALSVAFTISNGSSTPSNPADTLSSGTVEISGELKKWHKVILTFGGVNTCEDAQVNPFTQYRLNVTFTKGSKSYLVPGFYAADGNAAETSSGCGNAWRVYFSPDETGTWSYTVSFRTGNNISINTSPTAGSAVAPLDGKTGSFSISATDKTGKDFRSKGRLNYVGEHYLQFAETGEYYLKGGADSPENFLGYFEFDQTQDKGGGGTPGLVNGLHQYSPHVQDWHSGDPVWQGSKGKGIIGALNYLSSQGGNSVYFLTYNVDGGDGRDTWMWTSDTERQRFDCSKLDQWEIVFSHMDKLGIQMHVVTQETENEFSLGGSGDLNGIRKLYYRELIARFSHHLAVEWNLGEENDNSDAQRASFAQYIRELDPYNHPISYHTHYGQANSVYDGILANDSYRQNFEATSLQGNGSSYNGWAINLRNESAAAGRKWVVYGDEQGPAVDPNGNNLDELRKDALWGNLMGGGGGVEWYFGYQNTFGDLQSEDWRIVEPLWQQTHYALQFFHTYLPFHSMVPDNSLLSGSGNYCLAQPGDIYAVYLKNGGTSTLNINTPGIYTVKWYNPRSGGSLQNGNVTAINVTNPGSYSLGNPPSSSGSDWAVLITNNEFTNSVVTDIDGTCCKAEFSVFPNPAYSSVYISGKIKEPGNITFQLEDCQGKIVLNDQIMADDSFEKDIDLAGLSSGLYLLSMFIGKEKLTKKIVKY